MTESRHERFGYSSEEWVTVEGYPSYEVSSLGRVINSFSGKELKPSSDVNGYYRVALYNNGHRFDVLLHRLVAKCFILEYEDGIEVKQIDGDKRNCSVLNLEFGRGCRRK